MNFDFGRTHYGNIGNDLSKFFDECLSKFRIGYWGFADKQQWKNNNTALLDGEGEIRAQYRNENGIVIHFIYFEINGNKNTIFCTQEDLDDGFYDKTVAAMTKKPAAKGKASAVQRIAFF